MQTEHFDEAAAAHMGAVCTRYERTAREADNAMKHQPAAAAHRSIIDANRTVSGSPGYATQHSTDWHGTDNGMKSDYTESYEARMARIRKEVARRGSANEHSDEAAAAHGRGLHTTRTISR